MAESRSADYSTLDAGGKSIRASIPFSSWVHMVRYHGVLAPRSEAVRLHEALKPRVEVNRQFWMKYAEENKR